MPNPYFQFKQFLINQDQCGMKVCTDACILGAWAPVSGATRILDIGTGTGLLALMLAQRTAEAQIDAVEIDEAAAAQAKHNFESSPWANRLRLHRMALQHFVPSAEQPFDLIVSNPPFFINSLRSRDNNERLAKHTDSLSFADILAFAGRHLASHGKLVVMLPPQEQEYFAILALKAGFTAPDKLQIRDKAGGKVLRTISVYMRGHQAAATEQELLIKQADGQYSADFRALLKDFYLAF